MKPKDAFGRYGCVPREMHPAWQRVSYFARALGRDLISRVDDFDTMRIETSGEWRSSLCLTLCINGPERRNAKGALDALVAAGLLQTFDGFVVIGLQPVCTRSVSVQDPDPTQVTVTTQVTSDSKQAIKQARESDARARESSARFEKPPLPPPPPELPAPVHEPTSWLRVWQLYAAHRGLDPLQLGHPSRQREALTAVAAAAEVEAGGAQGDAFDRAVRRLLGAWSSDKWVKEKQPTIANLAANLHRYARAKIAKVVPLQPEDIRHKSFSDAELLALDPMLECDLDYPTKMRRWELQAREERKAGAAQ